jgi:hypothetical protein
MISVWFDRTFGWGITGWGVSKVTDISKIIMGVHIFNQPIGTCEGGGGGGSGGGGGGHGGGGGFRPHLSGVPLAERSL